MTLTAKATRLLLRNGTTQQHTVFTGSKNEVTVDSDTKTVRLTWTVTDESIAITALRVRIDRDQRLAACDWRFCSDVPFDQAWRDYRQALRDATQQDGFPVTTEWPVAPDATV